MSLLCPVCLLPVCFCVLNVSSQWPHRNVTDGEIRAYKLPVNCSENTITLPPFPPADIKATNAAMIKVKLSSLFPLIRLLQRHIHQTGASLSSVPPTRSLLHQMTAEAAHLHGPTSEPHQRGRSVAWSVGRPPSAAGRVLKCNKLEFCRHL